MAATTAYGDGSGEVLIDEIRELGARVEELEQRVDDVSTLTADAVSANRARINAIEESGEWRTRVRVNVAKTATKGYTADTTVEVEFAGNTPDHDDEAEARIGWWLQKADSLARHEMRRREDADRAEGRPA